MPDVCRPLVPAQMPLAIDAFYKNAGFEETSAHVASPDAPEQSLGTQSLCDELVDLYFEMIHDKQHALFHRPTFIAQQRSGQATAFLVLAMQALSARFSTHLYFGETKPSERGLHWAEQSRKLFNDREHAVSLTAIQGCALLANLAFIKGDSAMESLYNAQQIRMVQLLDLPSQLSTICIQREVEIRVWWTTWMMDTWTSNGVGVPKQLFPPPECPRPMEEEAFERLNIDELADLLDEHDDMERESGLWSQMVPLTDILAKVSQLNENTVACQLSRREVFDHVRDLTSRLDQWLFCLPEHLQITPDSLKRYNEKGFGRTLVALHLGYHHHSQQLYFQYLSLVPHSPAEESLASMYAHRCKEHAAKLSNLMWIANTTPGLECLWGINGHLLVVASAIHLHTLLFSPVEDQVKAAKVMLEHNFELLIQMEKLWPSLKWSMSRLRAFQLACRANSACQLTTGEKEVPGSIQRRCLLHRPTFRPSMMLAGHPIL
ncbi:hypothetical protein N7476_004765 [Penicillium atrosanguineum]|uniref:Xylanolytic transcriptional activator regulatory domain-containing protein n=1 Tax=Penicillium atrosanguineum TaxID=1132637 RepID=A0A9W9Q1B8_9EURO|nr:hypothetical protein N7476_004765 [Penicillium atrosanguineum]